MTAAPCPWCGMGYPVDHEALDAISGRVARVSGEIERIVRLLRQPSEDFMRRTYEGIADLLQKPREIPPDDWE